MIVSDETTENNDGHPDHECQDRQPLDRSTMAGRSFPILLVLSKRDLENGRDKRSDCYKKHLYPKRNGHQFADRLPDHHQSSRCEERTKSAGEPGSKTIR